MYAFNNHKKEEAMNFKDQDGYTGGLGRRKKKGKLCNYIISKNRKNEL